MMRLPVRREPGLGPSLIRPKRPGLGLVALRWWQELMIAGAGLSGFAAAVASIGLGPALVGAAGLAVAAGVACTQLRTRQLVAQVFWVLATPHRVRTCFARAWIYNERGQIPAVIRATARPWGESVLIWLRAGHSVADIESATELLAAACFATKVFASRDTRRGHLVYLDVIRWPERQAEARAEPEPSDDLYVDGEPSTDQQRPRLVGLLGDDWPSDDWPGAA